MRGEWIRYSQEELTWIKAHAALPRKEAHRQFVAAFDRGEVTVDNIKALYTRQGWRSGRTGRFSKGNVPVNKGVRCAPGEGGLHPNAVRTQFPKGHRGGVAARRYQPIGAERISKEGYVERKVHDGRPFQSRWRTVQRINWEAAHGPLPAGMILKCLDGNRRNLDLSNWEAMPRATLPYLNGHRGLDYDAAAPEVRPAIIAVAKVRHAAKQARRAAR